MNEVLAKGKKAKEIARELVLKSTEQKNEALSAIADQLILETAYILEENKKDIEEGKAKGFSDSLLDRLMLNEQRIVDMTEGIKQLIELRDPVGECVSAWERPNGLSIQEMRVPLGVVGMIYEARPNVTVDAATICLKTGNAVILRGSSSAIHSNKAIVAVIHRALKQTSLPQESVQLIEDTTRDSAKQLFTMNDYLDVLIPRGGKQLIDTVVREASVPVLETGAGNCHVFIDETADKQMAFDIINAKTQRPSVCNAIETIVLHEKWAEQYGSELFSSLKKRGVELRGDQKALAMDSTIVLASEEDWGTEFLSLTPAVKLVSSIEEAIHHINTYGSMHSEAIISENEEKVSKFFVSVDAAALYHNASTRFTDGSEFGSGAEIGISTQKLHVRGPMGLPALTSTKYVIRGNGQIRK
ncbi:MULTISPECIES: gamma-glutamyl phosphate reductase [Bacillus]|uniref:Gamma-glutamyl phosphate reductase n=4 Tax=Bacillus anthracis TaxID=1392 RepID=PROA_BACAN|nr:MULTISPECIES: gamma-glutamyl phosphate reductase [Bacillus]C3LEW9.1 RecName: Full=Gamma-glutamyl phosphate reductase; Short=GPR; AltName: Full=Glutamate-5-semialdehyde dehydrogenase; AltName: Full=Glutamyl-gamma-semialdehyde dehydrogenase; Short=GSA dehydrogenase [Bacillus anthracis str. CDC 684]C3NZU4.1 RecName: Full=Gamma-glutamyl phosphate reductase; Short=GPR; AltName: Full=Glutamate-5-semialdehyde dehydrogenase; AltName: Full=Glutamyl-gamma-semialdehyde dehydrogenase; Short=GSA dehydrogen